MTEEFWSWLLPMVDEATTRPAELVVRIVLVIPGSVSAVIEPDGAVKA